MRFTLANSGVRLLARQDLRSYRALQIRLPFSYRTNNELNLETPCYENYHSNTRLQADEKN